MSEPDLDLWFSTSPHEVEIALGLCMACPVIEQCRAGAIARSEPCGVWGGVVFEAGLPMVRALRPRGRPTKNQVCALTSA